MNNDRRKLLSRASDLIQQAYDMVYQASGEEEDAISNLPENMQGGDRAQDMEDCIEFMNDAMGYMEEAMDALHSAAM